jgi:hypothetical protein
MRCEWGEASFRADRIGPNVGSVVLWQVGLYRGVEA